MNSLAREATSPLPMVVPIEGRRPWRPKTFLGLALPALPVLVAIACALFSPLLAPGDPLAQDLSRRLQPPFWAAGGSRAAPLGTDQLGRDVLSRVIYGTRISLPVGLLATLLGAAAGGLLGMAAGYFRGRADSLITKLIDIQLSFPFILFAISVIAVTGPSFRVLVVVLALGSWVTYARVVRGETLRLREREFVQAAKALGCSHRKILFSHILPNVFSLLLVLATVDVGRIIILESTLSFLGLGVPPPTPTWGGMVSDASEYIRLAWWTAAFPGLAILLTVLSINLTGDALRDILDPRRREQGMPAGL